MFLQRFLTILICLSPLGAWGQTSSFVLTGSMNVQRAGHTATLLTNGLVLVTGGEISSANPTNTAELYDPALHSWRFTLFPMNAARSGHTATLHLDGRVLIAGGFDSTGNLSSVEIFDPNTEQFTPAAPLQVARRVHQAVLLSNGKVLVMGGYDGPFSSFSTSAVTEIFNPSGVGTWASAAPMPTAVVFFATARLLDGRVLVTGGESNGAFGLTNVSLYDPVANSWQVMSPSLTGRQSHTATTLNNGKVLIVAGNNRFVANNSVELYDVSAGPNGQSVSTTPIPGARVNHRAVLLPSGQVLIIGGQTESAFVFSSEIFDPVSSVWSDAGMLNNGRAGSTATLLPLAQVLVAGGVADASTGTFATNTAEIWKQGFLTFPLAGKFPDNTENAFKLCDPANSSNDCVAAISAVFDHDVNPDPTTGTPLPLFYRFNVRVGAYTDEEGVQSCGHPLCFERLPQSSHGLVGYKNAFDKPFLVNGNYTGGAPCFNGPCNHFLFYTGHAGYDYPASLGTEIIAPADGLLFIPKISETDPANFGEPVNKFNVLAIDHENGYASWFLHLGCEKGTNDPQCALNDMDFRGINANGTVICDKLTLTTTGCPVKRGAVIGLVGNKGLLPPSISKAHLHFELRKGLTANPGGLPMCIIPTCLPVDPYGWTGDPPDPYSQFLGGLPNIRLWE